MSSAPHVSRPAAALVAVALVAVACSGGGPEPSPPTTTSPSAEPAPSGSIAAIAAGAAPLSLLLAQSTLLTGPGELVFGLVTEDGGLITQGAPQIYAAQDDQSSALGPFVGTFHEFTAFERFPNTAPRSALTGFYTAQVDLPEAGNWLFAGVVDEAGQRQVGQGFLPVTDGPMPAQVGTEALSVETPVATTDEAARAICTRDPPDPMHYISLDEALTNGRPTVVNFGTPLLCSSQMCGPVVDETLAVYEDTGAEAANFIHVEIFPQRDQARPAEPFVAYGFTSEPITLVIDAEGIIRARWEGPVTADQITLALAPLL